MIHRTEWLWFGRWQDAFSDGRYDQAGALLLEKKSKRMMKRY
jgi:hypothetical protein